MQVDGRHNACVYGTDLWSRGCIRWHQLGAVKCRRDSSAELPCVGPRFRGPAECLLQLLGVQIHNGFGIHTSIYATVVCDHGTATRDMCAETPIQATVMRCSITCARASGVQPVSCSSSFFHSRKSGVSAVVVECDSYMTYMDIHTHRRRDRWQCT